MSRFGHDAPVPVCCVKSRRVVATARRGAQKSYSTSGRKGIALLCPLATERSMVDDFKSMAAKARADHDKRMAEMGSKATAEKDVRSRHIDDAVKLLEAEIMPLLKRAKADFAESGVDSKIATDFDVKNLTSRLPSVKFWCRGPKQASDNWQFDAPGVTFRSDGKDIKIWFGKTPRQNLRESEVFSVRTPYIAVEVGRALQHALEAYYQELETHQRDRTNLRYPQAAEHDRSVSSLKPLKPI